MDLKNNSIDWPQIIIQLKEFCTSELAQQKINQIEPFLSEAEALKSFSKIQAFQSLLATGNRPFMESLDLYYSWFTRLKKKALMKTLELKDIRHFLVEALSLSEYLSSSESPETKEFIACILNTSEPLFAIDKIITPSGSIKNDASEKLYKLYLEKQRLTKSVEHTLEKLVKKHQLETIIQDKYVTAREGRLVIPVKSGMQHNIEGIIHASSHSRQTVFMEPQIVVPMNNKLKQIEQGILDEIERLLRELSDYLHSLTAEFELTQETLLNADVLFSKAKLALLTNACAVTFDEKKIDLKNLRHPLLILNGESVVANSVTLMEEQRILLLTGPNAGGKTVLLKAVGLAAQMSRHGLLICAKKDSRLPFFKNLHMAVGDLQNIDESLSTFAGHLKVLNESLNAKGHDQLLLIDEICGSTDPEEGSALARSFITQYSKNNCFAVITSHLSPLKSGWSAQDSVVNGSLEYNAKTGRPTYQFIMGVPGDSLALQTAKRVGVDPNIIAQALNFLSPETKERQKSMSESEELRKELLTVKSNLEQELMLAQKEKLKYAELTENFDREKQHLLTQEVQKAQSQISTMIEHANVDKAFKNHETLLKMQAKLPSIIKSKEPPTEALTSEEFSQHFPPGTKVFVDSLGKDAIIQSKLNNKGEVTVFSGSMQIAVPWRSIKLSKKNQNKTSKILHKTPFSVSPVDSDRLVDLRGLSAEDAINQLEAQLDTAVLNEEDRIKIIHGFGTNTLKRTVRQYLSRSMYIKKWYAANSQQGGDGVTWAEL